MYLFSLVLLVGCVTGDDQNDALERARQEGFEQALAQFEGRLAAVEVATGNSGQLQSQIDVLQGTVGTLATQTSVAELDARVNAVEVEDLPDLDSRVEALELNQAALVPSGTIAVWSGDIANIPSGWRLCNGANGTPDLRDSFVMGAGGGADPWSTGGAN
ncbi:MAG TPA: hypothetical protein PKY30_07370, partial [Myxococcota bacterium]|nr:hypothetical protein [Myxococcota bacterium]